MTEQESDPAPTPSKSDFRRALQAAEDAIASRAPLTDEEKEQGWEEDPGGSGLRFNRITGEWDDRLFLSCPPWYAEYRAKLMAASRRRRTGRHPSEDPPG